MALLAVIPPATKPENPESTPVLLSVNTLPLAAEAIVNVPVPVSVPLTVISAVVPLPIVGLAPSGKLQLLLTVLAPAVCSKVTRLNVTLLQLRVAVILLSNVSVPLLALKVPPEIVKVDATVIVPEGAVKVPEDIVNAFRSTVV